MRDFCHVPDFGGNSFDVLLLHGLPSHIKFIVLNFRLMKGELNFKNIEANYIICNSMVDVSSPYFLGDKNLMKNL